MVDTKTELVKKNEMGDPRCGNMGKVGNLVQKIEMGDTKTELVKKNEMGDPR